MRPSIKATVLLALLLAIAIGVQAQERFGEINGTVTDPTGAVVPNVTVTITETNTNRSVTTKTGSDGSYVARSLDPGTYRVRFEMSGFGQVDVSNINVIATKVLTVNGRLEVATAGQTVQVTEAPPQIDVTTPLVAQNLTQGEFSRLPKARSFQSVVLTSANTTSGTLEGGIQVNGASASENQFVVDGISVNSVLQGQQRQNAVFEILQEVQVKTGGIEAQYGGATGGVITAVTRSGGNDFHGDIHYYYYGSPLNAGPPPRLLMDPTNLTTISNVQDYKSTNNNHEAGYTLGGRIIRDKLFFFSAASPQYQHRELPYWTSDNQRVTLNSDATYMQAYNKLSFTPFRWMSGNVGWLYTPSHQEGILPGYTTYGSGTTSTAAALLPNQNRGWFAPQSSYTADLTFTLSSTALLQVRGAYFWDNYKALGVIGRSAVEWGNSSIPGPTNPIPFAVPADLQHPQGFDTIPRVQTTDHDLTTRTTVQVDFSKYLGNFGGSHDFKVGFGRMKNVNNVDISYPGGGYVTLWWNTPFTDPITGQQKTGKYGYYQIDDIGTKGSTGGTIDNFYIQDRWRPIRRLSVDLGVRFEKEVVPSFRRDITPIAFEFGWGQKVAPRLGASYDVLGDGRMKLYGSWGLFYNWIPYELSRGTYGGDIWRRVYRSLDTLDINSLGNGNAPGTNLWNGPFQDLRSFDPNQTDPNIKPLSDYLVNLGFEYQVRPSTIVAVRYTRNHLRQAIEDLGTLDAAGSEIYLFGNPGEGTVTKSAPFNGIQITYPQPVRDYDGLEFNISRRFARRWFGTASYTYSRLYGNYTGLTSTDEVNPPATGRVSGVSQQSSGQATRPGTSSSRYYDLPYLVYDARGNAGPYGLLPTDRPHVIRLYGSYLFPFGTEVGGFFYGGSGTPMTTFVNTTQNAPVMVNGRGDMGRTPFLTRTDLLIAHEIKKFGEGRSLRLEFNAQNLFNQKTSTFTYNYYNRYNTASSGINLSSKANPVDFTKAYDWRALLAATADASKPTGALDPRYGHQDLFVPGFTGRFGVKFIF